MRRRAKLTNAEVGQAIAEYKAGRPVKAIARALNCDPVTIYNHLHARNIPVGKYRKRTTKDTRPEPAKPATEVELAKVLPIVVGGDWTEAAACKQVDGDMFYPERSATHFAQKAKKVCRTCPVTSQCLEHALANHEEYGVWGGLSARERKALIKRTTQQEGTPA